MTPENTPDIPGLTFRGFRGEADYPHMLAVIEAAKVADRIERSQTVEDIARNYSHLNNCDPSRDMIFAEAAGAVVGYGRCEWNVDKHGQRLYLRLGFLKPEWRRGGVGRAMLRGLQARLRQIAADHPAGPRFFEAFAGDTEAGAEALLRSEGYQPVRHFYDMVRPLSEPVNVTPLPDGIEIRPAGPEHYRAVWQADVEAFRDHWGYVAPTETDHQHWLASPEFQPHLWQIGWDSDQVTGMVLNFVNEAENREYNRRRGYTEGISVRRPWRQRGLARALLTRSLQMFKEMGMAEAALGADTENVTGALRLYESVGFRPAKRNTLYRKPMT